MRVLQISHGLPPESVGGVEQHVEGLTAGLVAAGHEVHVYTRTGRSGLQHGDLVDEIGPAGAPVTRVAGLYQGLDSFEMFYRDPRLDASFARFLQGRSFDIAHLHHVTGISSGILHALRDAGIPVVMTLHDYFMMCPRGQMWHREETVCESIDAGRCADCLRPTFGGWVPEGDAGVETLRALHDRNRGYLQIPVRIVTPSERVIPTFEAWGIDRERMRVVAYGVDVERLHKLALPAFIDDPERTLHLAYLGTLIPSKGLDVLVEAVTRLKPGCVKLDVFGNAVPYHGDLSYLTRVFSRLRTEDHVTYHGPYTTRDLPHILAQIDVLVTPALWHETYGITVREAMAAGRPVIVSRIGGVQDAIEDGVQGLIVEPGDAAALAGAIDALDRDRDRLRKMAEATRQGGANRSFQTMTAELVGIYREVLEE